MNLDPNNPEDTMPDAKHSEEVKCLVCKNIFIPGDFKYQVVAKGKVTAAICSEECLVTLMMNERNYQKL